MKKIRFIAMTLTFAMLFCGLISAQTAKSDKKIYDKAKQSIYKKDWEEAIKGLESLTEKFSDSSYMDESLYWMGYSLDKMSRDLGNMGERLKTSEKALGKLTLLISDYKSSSWIDDAKVLRVKIAEELVKKGHPKYRVYINGDLTEDLQKSDPDLEFKLVTLNALLGVDEGKALPILTKIINESKEPELREKAVFVLSQSNSSKVVPLLVDLAANDENPAVREQAIFWLGQRHDEASINSLTKLYAKETDLKIKEKLIFAFSQHKHEKSWKKLIAIAKTDKHISAREQAIFWVGQKKNSEVLELLSTMYKQSDNEEFKKKLIFSISQNKSDPAVTRLIEMARKEKNMELKKQIVFWLGQSNNEIAIAYLQEILNK